MMRIPPISEITRHACRVCGSRDLVPALNLGEQYLQGAFRVPGQPDPIDAKFPLDVVRCTGERCCGLIQLRHTVPPEVLYANYWYRSGTNATMRDHLAGIAQTLANLVGKPDAAVLDIGCNDGTLLNSYPESFTKYGVDPSDIATTVAPPVTVINTVFPSDQTRSAFADSKFDAVSSIAMFYDLEDPVGFARSIEEILSTEGVWVLEVAYLPLMLRYNAFDAICHEHLEYYHLAVLERIGWMVGLRCIKVEANESNGGSIRVYFCKKGAKRTASVADAALIADILARETALGLDTDAPYAAFGDRIRRQRDDLMQFMRDELRAGKKIHVYGASTKGNVLLQWYGIDNRMIDVSADRNPMKDGARTLGTEIAIVSEAASRAAAPDYYLVLPWHFKREFIGRERAIIEAGTAMIFPLPELTVVTAATIDDELQAFDGIDWLAF
jgi:NDP-4-keto-2,6-dideoxyhexose 3-C-methyltransferase